MRPARATPLSAVAATLLMSGCGLLAPPMPVAPDGGAMPMDPDVEPIGPVIEIGRGESVTNGPWRYEVYESRLGTCTRITFVDLGPGGGHSCGGSLAPEPADASVSLLSYGGSGAGGWSIEGVASDEVTEVWIELESGDRVPAVPLMSLRPVGIPAKLLYVETPLGEVPVRVVALGAASEPMGDVPIDAVPPR